MFVLIHGGGYSSRCWEPVIPLLDAPALASIYRDAARTPDCSTTSTSRTGSTPRSTTSREPLSTAPCSWARTRTFVPAAQDEMAARAGCGEVLDIDSGHLAMISHPEQLAAALNAVHARG
jgi:pimeloyl-ACP methyl ester carboxylesterase